MADSILQKEKNCYICGTNMALEKHHILRGINRQNADKEGLWVWLCHWHHTGSKDAVHNNKDLDKALRMFAQMVWEKEHSHDEWMRIFGRNYLE